MKHFSETVLECTSPFKLELIKLLVESGVDINVIDPISRRNCLHLNGVNGYLPLAEYLVNCGADLERKDIAERNPYQVAMKHDNYAVADFFLRAMWLRRIFAKRRIKMRSTSMRRLTMDVWR
ncbi:hypothetical protein HHI36_016031 [Cryptolaemus montrouzieri]|uniref:Ankyrin repeat domain-containing protein n=1 Tax=Cryptolaemus montrouzieri TaxID=559131 RepID=A0ABD2N768_9CUCU